MFDYFFLFFTGWYSLPTDGRHDDGDDTAPKRCEDSERDASDTSSESGSTAFKPSCSPSLGSKEAANGPLPGPSDYPSPNISVGPPIHPPHLLPYLYPPGLYPGGPHPSPGLHQLLMPGASPATSLAPPLSLFTNSVGAGHAPSLSSMNPSLLFNAQLALAAQHPLFGHTYPGLGSALTGTTASVTGPLLSERLKAHRFTPYSLPVSSAAPTSTTCSLLGGSPLGSAFETVTPSSHHNSPKHSPRSTSLDSPGSLPGTTGSVPNPLGGPPELPPPVGTGTPGTSLPHPVVGVPNTAASELKSIEKMVNGLEVQHDHVMGTDAIGKLGDK